MVTQDREIHTKTHLSGDQGRILTNNLPYLPFKMPNQTRDISFVDKESFPYVFEQNVDVPIKTFETGLVRVNVYRPKTDVKVPVLVTYGPYGKDIPYAEYVPQDLDTRHFPDHHTASTPSHTPR